MTDLMEAELKENRFAYLLQPIRDLAANWDIDIAAELGEYLHELDGITFAIQEGGPALNFAEAALLIQGTWDIPALPAGLVTAMCPQHCCPHACLLRRSSVLAVPRNCTELKHSSCLSQNTWCSLSFT